MLKVASFDGVDIYMYFKDHAPPHVHAFHGDGEVLVVLKDRSVYAGSLPPAKLVLVQAYVATNEVALLTRWAGYGGG